MDGLVWRDRDVVDHVRLVLGYFLAHDHRAGHFLDARAPGDSIRWHSGGDHVDIPDLFGDFWIGCGRAERHRASMGFSRTPRRIFDCVGRRDHGDVGAVRQLVAQFVWVGR